MRDPVKLTNNLQNNKYRCCSYVIQNRGVPCCYPIRYYYHLVYLSDSSRIASITKELIENTRCLFPVMTNYWINALVNIMHGDLWNDHNPKYSPIIIILKFNRTNPAIGNRGWKGKIYGPGNDGSIFRLSVIVAGRPVFIDFVYHRAKWPLYLRFVIHCGSFDVVKLARQPSSIFHTIRANSLFHFVLCFMILFFCCNDLFARNSSSVRHLLKQRLLYERD